MPQPPTKKITAPPNINTHRKVAGLGWIKRGSEAETRYLKQQAKKKGGAGKGKGAVYRKTQPEKRGK